jgi:hypothetical protein
LAGKNPKTLPIMIAAAIAAACVGLLILQVRNRWHPPQIMTAQEARASATGKVARAAGAMVLPTDPMLSVEPKAAGPKRAQPAIPF